MNYTTVHLPYYWILQDVRETVFVLLIPRVDQDVCVEDVGKVDAVKDVGVFVCAEIHI